MLYPVSDESTGTITTLDNVLSLDNKLSLQLFLFFDISFDTPTSAECILVFKTVEGIYTGPVGWSVFTQGDRLTPPDEL